MSVANAPVFTRRVSTPLCRKRRSREVALTHAMQSKKACCNISANMPGIIAEPIPIELLPTGTIRNGIGITPPDGGFSS